MHSLYPAGRITVLFLLVTWSHCLFIWNSPGLAAASAYWACPARRSSPTSPKKKQKTCGWRPLAVCAQSLTPISWWASRGNGQRWLSSWGIPTETICVPWDWCQQTKIAEADISLKLLLLFFNRVRFVVTESMSHNRGRLITNWKAHLYCNCFVKLYKAGQVDSSHTSSTAYMTENGEAHSCLFFYYFMFPLFFYRPSFTEKLIFPTDITHKPNVKNRVGLQRTPSMSRDINYVDKIYLLLLFFFF